MGSIRDENVKVFQDLKKIINEDKSVQSAIASSIENQVFIAETDDVKINIPTESFNKLPIFDEDYKVQVKYNENKNAYRIVFSTSKVAILVACSVN